jgi:hypothetical protein
MKKLILSALACIALVITSCNQNSPAPAPATPTTPTPTPTSSMTTTEAALVGDWIWDKTETYQSGNLSQIWTPSTSQLLPNAAITNTMYAGTHMVLKSSFYNGTANTSTVVPQNYNGDFYSNQSAVSWSWSNWPQAGGNNWLNAFPAGQNLVTWVMFPGYIITLNSTTLVVQAWQPGQIANGYKWYYHK